MFGKIGQITDRFINNLESFKESRLNRTPDFHAQPFSNSTGQATALQSLARKFAEGQQTKTPAVRQPTEWEQKALNKLDQLAKANDGYLATSDETKGLRKAKAEIKQIITAQKPGQSDRGVEIATFAILNVGNGRFNNNVSTSVQDSNGKSIQIEGSSQDESFKCNIFVAAAHVEGGHVNFKDNAAKGAGFPLVNGKAPATNWLGDKQDQQHLSNLKIVTDNSLKPGDVIAWRNTDHSKDGHSAIYIGGGMVAYSGSGDEYGGLVTGGAPKVMTLKDLNSNLRPSLAGRALGADNHEAYVVRRYAEK
jgi:hypothetical protein